MKRCTDKLERLDTGDYTEEEHRRCLYLLERIGRLTGGDAATLRAFDRLKTPPKSIIDVGCGGGHLAYLLAKRYPNAAVRGVDLNSQAIDYAKQYKLQNLTFESRRFQEGERADVITATLFNHHLSDEENILFLSQAARCANEAVILNDLVRSPLAYALYSVVAPIAFPSRLIYQDGLLSIRRSFKRPELEELLKKSKVEGQIERCGFRWIIRLCPLSPT